MKEYRLKYYSPAEDSLQGWEKQSLPIGNGYFGASIFGGTGKERVQFTSNVFANTYALGGVTDMAELYIKTQNAGEKNYERGLNLKDGTAYSFYEDGDKKVTRLAFASYPDNVFVYKAAVENGRKDFFAELVIPYLNTRKKEEGGREGRVYAQGETLVLRETLPLRELVAEIRLNVFTDGIKTVTDSGINIKSASEVVFTVIMGTNYKLCAETFFDGNNKALGEDPHEELVLHEEYIKNHKYSDLYERHLKDYDSLMSRAYVDLGGKEDSRSTEELLKAFKDGENTPYLIETYFAFGRHLLISSSRKGGMPASLQGVWSAHDKSPWGSGIWHNINVQMNYWCALNTNLAETFLAYADYFKAYKPRAEKNAKEWVQAVVPEKSKENSGWTIGTSAFCYEISGPAKGLDHSGPGTGGLTAKMFADYYDYTLDENFLKEYAYPAVHGCAEFMDKSVKKYGNEYLCRTSASPEQILSGVYQSGYKSQQYYATVGCAFDQQMLYETAKDDIRFSKKLGVNDVTVNREKKRLEKYSPVKIGYSGQVKEYGEENFYGEIGAEKHRHVSQLVGLMPGSIINFKTPAWIDSAKRTLDLRGYDSSGWALAHRLLLWARTGDGDKAYMLLSRLLKNKTHSNLWDDHPPFQIDGNFGATAGIAEMLMQSHGEEINLFPAVPKEWKTVSFYGLKARGNFTVSAKKEKGGITFCEITAILGGTVTVRAEGLKTVTVKEKSSGKKISLRHLGGKITFNAEKGTTYILSGFSMPEELKTVKDLSATWKPGCVKLKWKGNGEKYAVYRAIEDDKDYRLLTVTDEREYSDKDYNEKNKARLTYKIVAVKKDFSQNSVGAVVFLSPATELMKDRYKLRLKVNNIYAKDWTLR